MIKIGYRSDIRIVTSKDGFQKLTEFVENYLKEKNLDDEYNLLKSIEKKIEGKEQVYFGWNSLKWYEGDYPDVDAIMDGLSYLAENDYSYRYMRIGEDYTDCDEQSYNGEKEDIYLEYPCMIRGFDDEYLNDLIVETVEQNKEEIDI